MNKKTQNQNSEVRLRSLSRLSLLTLAFSVACATTYKQKILQNTLIAAATGAAIGATYPNYQTAHEVMLGGTLAAVAAVASTYYYDPDQEIEKYKSESIKLKAALDEIMSPKIIGEMPGTFNSKIPDKFKKLINPGEWKLSELDQWSEDGENRLIHQDKLMELIPPSLKPNQGVTK